jgi:hypothetical protein
MEGMLMYQNIIVEGPDGAGKTTLIDRYLSHFGHQASIELHPKFADSLSGPPVGLDLLVDRDIHESTGRTRGFIYDRHPLISEPIYGPICRDSLPGNFNHDWWLKRNIRTVARMSVLVLCLPPYHLAYKQAGEAGQMSGVMDNFPNIYNAYVQLGWPGVILRYDRTNDTITDMLWHLRKLVNPNG